MAKKSRSSRPKSAAAILNKVVSRCKKAKTQKQCNMAIKTAKNQLYHNKRVLKSLGVKKQSRGRKAKGGYYRPAGVPILS